MDWLIALRCSLASAKASFPAVINEPAEPITDTGSSWLVDLSSQNAFGSLECIARKASAGLTQPRSFSISRRKVVHLIGVC